MAPHPARRPNRKIARLRSDGFDFVRIPFDPSPLLAVGLGARQDALIADLRATVRHALDSGLTVIVDLPAVPRPDEVWGVDDLTLRLWPDHLILVSRIGGALHGQPPDSVAFGPLNEPTVDCDAVWAEAARLWPDKLRAMHRPAPSAAPNLPLVVSEGGLNDANTLWSFHSHDPLQVTRQLA